MSSINNSPAYFREDFEQEWKKWGADNEIVMIRTDILMNILLQKEGVLEFLDRSGIKSGFIQQKIERGVEDQKENWAKQSPESIIPDNTPKIADILIYNRMQNRLDEVEMKGIRLDAVTLFASLVESINDIGDGLDDYLIRHGVKSACEKHLISLGLPTLDFRGYPITEEQSTKSKEQRPLPDPQTSLLEQLQNPDMQALLKHLIADAVKEGIAAHEKEKSAGIGDAMAKSWVNRS